jgi:prepilin-type N-terminal cleavage/methylation domain-containing protein
MRSRSPRPYRGNDDQGFSLIEVLVALTLIAVIFVAADRGAIEGLSAAALVKERSVASGLMTSAMAEAIALPFSDLENGLNPTTDTSFATDPNIVASGSTNCSATPPTSGYELKLKGSVVPTSTSTIPVCNTKTSDAPLVPHVSTVLEGINYNVYAYPTTSTSAPGLVTVVVVVTWKSPTGNAQQVVGEDGVAAP